ncbi:MAG: hypothetical protein EOM67_15875 [Spirochaetia bacterium]|nr:hypothetical protein [Spirochaetia bacterium]
MFSYKTGDLLAHDAQALVNAVNCVGVMGKGIALQFKKKFPQNFDSYVVACNKKEVNPGIVHIFQTNTLFNPQFIINFPTKRDWKDSSRIEDITSGLDSLRNVIKKHHITSIAIPPLGCGMGGLNWDEVKILIIEYLGMLEDVEVILFEP